MTCRIAWSVFLMSAFGVFSATSDWAMSTATLTCEDCTFSQAEKNLPCGDLRGLTFDESIFFDDKCSLLIEKTFERQIWYIWKTWDIRGSECIRLADAVEACPVLAGGGGGNGCPDPGEPHELNGFRGSGMTALGEPLPFFGLEQSDVDPLTLFTSTSGTGTLYRLALTTMTSGEYSYDEVQAFVSRHPEAFHVVSHFQSPEALPAELSPLPPARYFHVFVLSDGTVFAFIQELYEHPRYATVKEYESNYGLIPAASLDLGPSEPVRVHLYTTYVHTRGGWSSAPADVLPILERVWTGAYPWFQSHTFGTQLAPAADVPPGE